MYIIFLIVGVIIILSVLSGGGASLLVMPLIVALIGMRPMAIYSRKSKYLLNQPLPQDLDSWEIYGTNLSVKNTDGWSHDDVRLILFDIKNFGILGLASMS